MLPVLPWIDPTSPRSSRKPTTVQRSLCFPRGASKTPVIQCVVQEKGAFLEYSQDLRRQVGYDCNDQSRLCADSQSGHPGSLVLPTGLSAVCSTLHVEPKHLRPYRC